MLVIAGFQLQAMRSGALRAFEDRTLIHLARYFPRHLQLLGEVVLRRVIRLGLDKATGYGLAPECCVRSYVEFMCRLGSAFDTDPLLPWAARILADQTRPPVVRGDRLYDEAWQYIDAISADYRDATGAPTTARFAQELKQLRHGSDAAVPTADLAAVAARLAARLQDQFPAKCAYVGEPRVHVSVARAVGEARAHGLAGERGITLFAVLQFVLGHGFADDPLLPFADAALGAGVLRDEPARVDQLYAGGLDLLKRWWQSAPPVKA